MKFNSYIIALLIVGTVVFSSCKAKKEGEKKSEVTAVEGLNLGNMAPEIIMKTPKDSLLKLSSLRGKVVLIDFWASWCRPCRIENPNVVKVYDKYRSAKLKNAKGFTVFSVSLDMNKPMWEQAITTDNLSWPYHVSDLAGWNNAAAAKYGVNGIPTNFLIDAKGVIIGKALRGEDLEKALENLTVK
jgi:thiol-disulfide isomerase/thioredoxin